MWQCVPSVICTQYACLLMELCKESVAIAPVGQSFLPASTDSIFAWLLLGYAQHVDHFLGRIICNLFILRFCFSWTQKCAGIMHTFFYQPYWSCTYKKSLERTIYAPQNSNLSSLYIQFVRCDAIAHDVHLCWNRIIICIYHCGIQILCHLDASFMVLHFGWPAVCINIFFTVFEIFC